MKGRLAPIGSLAALMIVLAACTPAAPPPAPTAPAAPPTAAKPAAAAPATAPAASPAASPSPVRAAASPIAVASPIAAAKPAETGPIADFYRGKTVKIIVGHGAGGGYDTYSRLIARHLGRNIPGNPTVIVENMTGADGAISANHLYAVAPKDGTVIGNFIGDLFLRRVLGQSGLTFEVTGWHHLGAPSISEYVCQVSAKSGFKDLKEIINPSQRQLVLGGYSILEASALILKEALNANIKVVTGYDGTAKIRLAMDQGEVDGMCGNSWESLLTTSPNELQDRTYVILAQLTSKKKAGVPQGDAPLIYELLKSEEDKAFVRAGIEDPGLYARPYMLPPGVPVDRVAALRTAFEATMVDKEFLADAEKARLTVEPIRGAEIDRLIKASFELPDAIKARLKPILVRGS